MKLTDFIETPRYRRFQAQSQLAARVFAADRVSEILQDQPDLTGAEVCDILDEDVRAALADYEAREDAQDW